MRRAFLTMRWYRAIPPFDERQHLLNIVADHGPITSKELWLKAKQHENLTSKSKMKLALRSLKKRDLLATRPDPPGPFKYHIVWNKYERQYSPIEEAPPAEEVAVETN